MIQKTTLSETTPFKDIMLTNNNIKNIKKYCLLITILCTFIISY